MTDACDSDDETWSCEQRAAVIDYLTREKLVHGDVSEDMAARTQLGKARLAWMVKSCHV